MSSAWEILEKQSKEKIVDAAAWEGKLQRASIEVRVLLPFFPFVAYLFRSD